MTDPWYRCEVCRSIVEEDDLFCPNCGTEVATVKPQRAAGESGRVLTHQFECTGCGASMSYDATSQALRCPFCGSRKLEGRSDRKVLAPRWVIPFQIDETKARELLHHWLARGFWRPNDLARESTIATIQAVYVPYWSFSGKTHTYWTADTNRTPPSARASWFPLSGEHRGQYEGLLIGASRVLTESETAALCPFDLTQGVAPSEVDLENVTVELFKVPRKYARHRASELIEEQEAETCRRLYVPGNARNVHVNVVIEELVGEPILVPIWILTYRYRNRPFRFLINGQTGSVTGAAPISWIKVAFAVGLILVIVLIGMNLLRG